MKRLIFILAFFLLATSAQAAFRYASPSGSGSACTVISTPCTLTTAKGQLVAGDTLHLLNGTYTTAIGNNVIPSGISQSQPTIIEGESIGGAIIRPTTPAQIISFGQPRSNITIRKLILDVNKFNQPDPRLSCISLSGDLIVYTNFLIEDIDCKNGNGTGIFLGVSASNITVRRVKIHDIRNTSPSAAHGGIYANPSNSLYEYIEIYNVGSSGMTFRSGTGNTVRYSIFRENAGFDEGAGSRAINVSTANNTFHNNIFAHNYDNGITITPGGTNTKIFNNVFYANGISAFGGVGLSIQSGVTGVQVTNNIAISNASGQITNSAGAGATLTTNLTSGTAADIFVDPPTSATDAVYNLCLKSTASTAINSGTAITGFAFNGAAPEIGACEVIETSGITAVATDSSVDLSLPINIASALPLLPASGITGFTLSDARTVTSATRIADGIIRLAYTGTCTGGTVSYSPGNVTDSILIGNLLNQPLFAFSGKAVTNDCGGGTPTPPPGLHIDYALDEGTGTNANDGTANNLDGTLTTGPTWVSGHTGSAVHFAPNVQDYIAVPYGNAVNPSTQSLTIALAVLPDVDATAATYTVFSAPVGTNQRLQIVSNTGTWATGIQASGSAINSEFPITATWTRLCLVMNSSTDTATLHVNGVAGTSAQSIKAYTSYALAGNFDIGRLSGVTNNFGFAADDFALWTSVESCADDFAAWSPPAPAPGGALTQVAYQLYLARKDSGGNLLKLPLPGAALNASAVTPAGGVVAIEIQVNCDNVANCDPLGMVLQRAPIGVDTWSDVPDSDIGAVSFYGTADSGSEIPSGVPTCPLSGVLVCVNGGTIRTASAVPTIDLGQNQSTVNRYLVKVNESSRFRLRNQSGNIFGTYTQYPTVNVVGAFAGVGM